MVKILIELSGGVPVNIMANKNICLAIVDRDFDESRCERLVTVVDVKRSPKPFYEYFDSTGFPGDWEISVELKKEGL